MLTTQANRIPFQGYRPYSISINIYYSTQALNWVGGLPPSQIHVSTHGTGFTGGLTVRNAVIHIFNLKVFHAKWWHPFERCLRQRRAPRDS